MILPFRDTDVFDQKVVPTFKLTLEEDCFIHPARFKVFSDFLYSKPGRLLSSLVIHFPKYCALSYILPPGLRLPHLTSLEATMGRKNSHPMNGNNYAPLHLVQHLLNAAPQLERVKTADVANSLVRYELGNLHLHEQLKSVEFGSDLCSFDFIRRLASPRMKRNLIFLTLHAKERQTISSAYTPEGMFGLLQGFQSCLQTLMLLGPIDFPNILINCKEPIVYRMPRMPHLRKLFIVPPWKLKIGQGTTFNDLVPKVEHLGLAGTIDALRGILLQEIKSAPKVNRLTIWIGAGLLQTPEPSQQQNSRLGFVKPSHSHLSHQSLPRHIRAILPNLAHLRLNIKRVFWERCPSDPERTLSNLFRDLDQLLSLRILVEDEVLLGWNGILMGTNLRQKVGIRNLKKLRRLDLIERGMVRSLVAPGRAAVHWDEARENENDEDGDNHDVFNRCTQAPSMQFISDLTFQQTFLTMGELKTLVLSERFMVSFEINSGQNIISKILKWTIRKGDIHLYENVYFFV